MVELYSLIVNPLIGLIHNAMQTSLKQAGIGYIKMHSNKNSCRFGLAKKSTKVTLKPPKVFNPLDCPTVALPHRHDRLNYQSR
jgi:hypothetical protein